MAIGDMWPRVATLQCIWYDDDNLSSSIHSYNGVDFPRAVGASAFGATRSVGAEHREEQVSAVILIQYSVRELKDVVTA